MRPTILNPLFRDVATLKGVGPVVREALRRLLGYHSVLEESGARANPVIRDLLFHVPSGMVDRRHITTLAAAPLEQTVTVTVTVEAHQAAPRHRRGPYRITCADETGDMVLVFFNAKPDYLKQVLPVGGKRVISGTIELYDGMRQMVHPEAIAPLDKLQEVARLEPNYPLTHGLGMKTLRHLIAQALSQIPELPEWTDETMRRQQDWPGWVMALTRLHQPQSPADIGADGPAFQRLAYDELLANQLALTMIRRSNHKQSGIIISAESRLQEEALQALPFALTDGQYAVLAEMIHDMTSGERMLRLLMGDVGSGKTVVALLAMLAVIDAGYQAALMVPTEILGRQHANSLSRLTAALGIKIAVLTGKLSGGERRALLEAIAAGEVHIVIGTHALFQESVHFDRLGMVVIDEQHRFGVGQRLALSAKGEHPHVLLMTATPIPRSLALTAYGDMDSSALREKPAMRQPIDTRVVPLSRVEAVVNGLRRALEQGSKVYWICPLVEETEGKEQVTGDLAAAEERYRVFKAIFGERVALAHGKQKAPERQAAMQGFAGDAYDILVATTVVEVGVDVPEATIMVIEHAERFGLAQLHQLRGRVGRGDKPSSCVLLYAENASDIAKKRLKVIRDSQDGFAIAEEDMRLRGAGDALGTRQSGMPDFCFADLALHRDLVLAARDDVKLLMHRDPELAGTRGQALRILLYLFDYDASLRFLRAG